MNWRMQTIEWVWNNYDYNYTYYYGAVVITSIAISNEMYIVNDQFVLTPDTSIIVEEN